jgi:hypothetical protein
MARFFYATENAMAGVTPGVPGDRGCPSCGKIAARTGEPEGTMYVYDPRGRYWCLSCAGEALKNVRRRQDDRSDPGRGVYPWRFDDRTAPIVRDRSRDRVAEALRERLRLMGDETIPMRRGEDGRSLRASELVAMLDAGDDAAMQFLDDVVATATRLLITQITRWHDLNAGKDKKP